MAERENERGSGTERRLLRGKAHEAEDAGLQARLDRLSQALDAQKAAAAKESEEAGKRLADGSIGSAMSLGFRVLTEFVAAVVVGTLIGWQIDSWTGTAPLFLVLFLGLGTAAGFVNVYRIAAKPTGTKRDST